ncbi:MAG TPA: RteC domain-containing protein [Mucilaginibacter sp.]|jgi:hypothetical protein|nr:RteC domain-containing protein [Mucilaginibacter sp.]
MRTITERFYSAMENQLKEVSQNNESTTDQLKSSIKICKKAMAKLKSYIASYAFENTTEEVNFFKEVKPQFYSKYIYFINVYNFTMQRPTGSDTIQHDYIKFHLDELKTFFDHNRAFYQYYRAGMTQMDEIYFTRGGFDVHVELEDFEEDEKYSTSHDYKLSKIIANERFQEYLNLEMVKVKAGVGELLFPLPFTPANWTAAKTDAVELIYSLKASGSVNNGNIDISELVSIWEYVFQIDLKEYYHKFTDITRRKKDVPVFLNKLKDALIRWINDKMSL